MNNANTEQQLLYWSAIRINDIIADWYRKESGATVFKTFAQWKTDGFNIKKAQRHLSFGLESVLQLKAKKLPLITQEPLKTREYLMNFSLYLIFFRFAS